MPKLNHKPVKWDGSLSYSQNLANAINDHWGCNVAFPVGDNAKYSGNVFSNMQYGCPPAKEMPGYKHPDIVWLHIDERGKWIIRRRD